jgi:hypothetical protein
MVAKPTGAFAHFDLSSDIECELLATALELYLNGNRDNARSRNGIALLTEKQYTTVETIARQMDQSPLTNKIMQEYMEAITEPSESGSHSSFWAIAREIELYALEEALAPVGSDAYEAAVAAWNGDGPLRGGSPSPRARETVYSSYRPADPDVGSSKARSSTRHPANPIVGVREDRSPSSQPASSGAGAPDLQLPDFSSLRALFPNIPAPTSEYTSTKSASQHAPLLSLGDGPTPIPRQRASGLDGADDEDGDSRSEQIVYDAALARALQQSEMAKPGIPFSQPSLGEPAGAIKNVGYSSFKVSTKTNTNGRL